MQSILSQFRSGVLAVFIVAGVSESARGQATKQGVPAHGGAFRTTSATNDSLYSFAESDFVVGKAVFLRSSKMRYGTVLAVDANHRFPRSFGKTHMKAVLIRRKDGPYEWTPVERVVRIYVVNKS
jgi:hypothetical protein